MQRQREKSKKEQKYLWARSRIETGEMEHFPLVDTLHLGPNGETERKKGEKAKAHELLMRVIGVDIFWGMGDWIFVFMVLGFYVFFDFLCFSINLYHDPLFSFIGSHQGGGEGVAWSQLCTSVSRFI